MPLRPQICTVHLNSSFAHPNFGFGHPNPDLRHPSPELDCPNPGCRRPNVGSGRPCVGFGHPLMPQKFCMPLHSFYMRLPSPICIVFTFWGGPGLVVSPPNFSLLSNVLNIEVLTMTRPSCLTILPSCPARTSRQTVKSKRLGPWAEMPKGT